MPCVKIVQPAGKLEDPAMPGDSHLAPSMYDHAFLLFPPSPAYYQASLALKGILASLEVSSATRQARYVSVKDSDNKDGDPRRGSDTNLDQDRRALTGR